MSNNNIFRIAGIVGILARDAHVGLDVHHGSLQRDVSGIRDTSSCLGIILAAGLYLLYRSEASALSLFAVAASVIGYLLLTISGILQLTFPNPVLAAGDIMIYMVGL